MKKKLVLIIGALIVILVIGMYLWYVPKYDADQVKSITLITLPSPPQCKIVTDQKDIETCLNYLDSLNLVPAFNTGKGWWFMIKIDQYTTISFLDEYISFNGKTFKIKNRDYANYLRELYKSMNYEEKAW